MYFDPTQLDRAMRNSYSLIIKGTHLWEFFERETDGFPAFIHNPARKFPKKEELESLLEYFTQQEEFEKCISIKEHIEKGYPSV